MRVTHSLTYWVSVSIDFTDVTLVSDDTYRRLYWCDTDHSDDPENEGKKQGKGKGKIWGQNIWKNEEEGKKEGKTRNY